MPPGTGGSNSFVQQRQEQRSGMRLAPSHPLHPEDLSSGPTTGHPRAACEGRLLGLPCPDPEAAGSSCTIYQAASTDFLSVSRCGAFSAQSRPRQCAELGTAAPDVRQSLQPHPQNQGCYVWGSARTAVPTSHGSGIQRAHSSISQHGSRTGKLTYTRPENTLKIKMH